MRTLIVRTVGVAVALLGFALAPQISSTQPSYAPLDQPGPPLSVPLSQLRASLSCEPGVNNARTEPVLLSPGTGSTASENFGWNWEPALDQLGIPWCAYTPPHYTLDDITTSGEYLVYAIRTMYSMAHRPIAVMGHSQGGMVPRWALRFWPDTRAMVDDQIGFAPSNHGTVDADPACSFPCPAAFWQQRDSAEFIKALNSYQETFPGISYTEIYTHTDQVVVPNFDDTGSSSLHGGGGQITDVAIQDVCPLDLSEHLAIGTMSNTAYALAIDALEHPGPADPSRIPASVCSQYFMPGVNQATVLTDMTSLDTDLVENIANGRRVPAEPPLECYVTASCGEGAAAAKVAKCKRKHKKGHRAEASKKRHCKKRHKKR